MKRKKRNKPLPGAQTECAKCDHLNPPDRMFCGNCGAKLPLAKNPFEDVPQPSRVKPLLKQIPRLITLLILLCLGLAVWPPAYIGMEGRHRSAEVFSEKIQKLRDGVESGRKVTVVVNETGINAFLKKRLNKYLKQNQFARGTLLKSVRMMITPQDLLLQVKTDHGPLTLTRQIRGVPKVENNKFVFDVEKVSLGILPLPPPLDNFVSGRIKRIFAQMDDEREVVANLSRIELSEGKVRLTVQGENK